MVARVGQIVPPPSQVTAAMDSLDAWFNCLEIMIRTTPRDPVADTPFVQGWDQRIVAWKRFLENNRSEATMLLKGTTGLLRQIDEYRADLVGWFKLFHARWPDARPSCPDPPTEPYHRISDGFSLPWYVPVGLTLAAVGALYVGYRYLTAPLEAVQVARRAVERDVARDLQRAAVARTGRRPSNSATTPARRMG